jgi:hypothetical protein
VLEQAPAFAAEWVAKVEQNDLPIEPIYTNIFAPPLRADVEDRAGDRVVNPKLIAEREIEVAVDAFAQDDTGWEEQPPVALNVRRVDGSFDLRAEQQWPLPRTQWTKFHLDIANEALPPHADNMLRETAFDAMGDGLTFWTEPLPEDLELTGPGAGYLRVASSTTDADVFLTLRVQDPDGVDVTFPSAMDPHPVVGFGLLRASLRKLDPSRSTPYRPWHTFDERRPLTPGEPVDVQVEIWPTSVIIRRIYCCRCWHGMSVGPPCCPVAESFVEPPSLAVEMAQAPSQRAPSHFDAAAGIVRSMGFGSRGLAALVVAISSAVTLAVPAMAAPVDGGESAESVIDGLKAQGYNVVINWLTGYDTVSLSLCTVDNVNNPDDSASPAGTFTTVYVDVSCPNHPDE